jgi:hypothetical protein
MQLLKTALRPDGFTAPRAAATFTRRRFLQAALAGGAALAGTPHLWAKELLPTHAQGRVTPAMSDVAVSNGREVTLTDAQGRWRLPIEDEATTFFVIKPRGWQTQLSPHRLPRGYYHHQPAGSPVQKFPGLAPTGALPDTIDFPLARQEEGDRFTALVCGDPQPRNAQEVGYLAQSVVPALRGTKAAFGVSLGDIAYDDLSTLEPYTEAFGLIGVPWYNLVGNHDLNFDAPDNRQANETFRRVFGPPYHAFNYGPVHFLVLRNVEWLGPDPEKPASTANYRGGLGERQLEFVANDLRHVPAGQLVVVFLHIPLSGFEPAPRTETRDRQELYRLLEGRPNTLSFSAHTHRHWQRFYGGEDGWRGAQPHHHVVTGTLCGSWFSGAPDSDGVPHGMMSDGTPRGYLEVEFDGPRYSMDGYAVLGRPRDYQMHIETPAEVARDALAETPVVVNVFHGSVRSTVRLRCGEGDTWRTLAKVEEADPRFVRLRERDQDLQLPYRALPTPMPNCQHLWRGALPAELPLGTYLLEVVAEDMFGHSHRGSRTLRVLS